MRFKTILQLLLCMLLTLCGSEFLHAQDTTSLGGRITDSSGAIVPGATVKLTLVTTGATRINTTNSGGQYQFSQLAPGKYDLLVTSTGRFAHRLLAQEDVAMPVNLTSKGSPYFGQAAQLAKLARANVNPKSLQPIPYWEQVFGGLDNQDVGLPDSNGKDYGPMSATQNVYAVFLANLYNETYALYQLDTPGNLPNSSIGAGVNYPAYRFYHDQYSALYAWRSIGFSNFNALEVVYRQHFGAGLQADFNYTFSKSLDITSQAERLGSSGGINYSQIMNSWNPAQLYGPSDYDVRHQINSNFIWDLPVGRGKKYFSGMGRITNELGADVAKRPF